ncbi:MAG: hypothetical protein QXZ43_02820 [Candidatus Aenigmatarchaeota archaeon]
MNVVSIFCKIFIPNSFSILFAISSSGINSSDSILLKMFSLILILKAKSLLDRFNLSLVFFIISPKLSTKSYSSSFISSSFISSSFFSVIICPKDEQFLHTSTIASSTFILINSSSSFPQIMHSGIKTPFLN